MRTNGSRYSPVSCGYNLGAWAFAVRLVEEGKSASDGTLRSQDPSVVRRDIVCKRGSVSLGVSNALTSDVAGTEGALQTIAESWANGGTLSPVNAMEGVGRRRNTYKIVGLSRTASDNEVVRPTSRVIQEIICIAANCSLDDLKGSCSSHTNEDSTGEGVLHDGNCF